MAGKTSAAAAKPVAKAAAPAAASAGARLAAGAAAVVTTGAAGPAAVPAGGVARRTVGGRRGGAKETFTEVASNEIWRESIQRETKEQRRAVSSYSCNLRSIKRDQITEPPTLRKERLRELSPEEDAMACKILADYGVKIKKADPSNIHFPPTTNGGYGLLNFYSFADDRRVQNAKTGCEETKYAQNFYSMTGKSAFSNKL